MRWMKTAAGLLVPMPAFAAGPALWEWMGFPGCCPDEGPQDCTDCHNDVTELTVTLSGMANSSDCSNCSGYNGVYVVDAYSPTCLWANDFSDGICHPAYRTFSVSVRIRLLESGQCDLLGFLTLGWWHPYFTEVHGYQSAPFAAGGAINYTLPFSYTDYPPVYRHCDGSLSVMHVTE